MEQPTALMTLPAAEAPADAGYGLSLEEWMRAEEMITARGNFDYAALADRLGMERTSVYRTATGKYKVSGTFIDAVIRASAGRVDANRFFDRAYSEAAASRGGEASESPFSSTSSAPRRRPRPANDAASPHPRPSRPRQPATPSRPSRSSR